MVDVDEAQIAELKNKTHLSHLILHFGDEEDQNEMTKEEAREENESRIENDVLVLNALEPPKNLEYLIIGHYMGRMYPNWLMSLTTLRRLYLRYYPNLEHLAPLGKLLFFESFYIWGAASVKKVGGEFLGIEESKNKNKEDIFPNLKSLEFAGLVN